MAEDVALVQSVILKACGFVPLSGMSGCFGPCKNPINHFLRAFAVVLLLVCSAGWIFNASATLYSGISGISGDNERPFIVSIVELLADFFYTARAMAIMTVFLARRHDWVRLHGDAARLLAAFFPDPSDTLRRLQRWSGMLFAVTFTCHVVWVCMQWITSEVVIDLGLNSTRSDYEFFTFILTVREYVSFWAWLDALFILSQQVLMCSLIMAVLLSKLLDLLEDQIRVEIVKFQHEASRKNEPDIWADLTRKTRVWTDAYTESCKLMLQFNDLFSVILFISVGLDVISTLAFAGAVLSTKKDFFPPVYVMYQVCNACLFLSYATVFLQDFVILHEKSQSLAVWSRKLLWTVSGFSLQRPNKNILTDDYADHDGAGRDRAVRGLEHLSAIVRNNELCVDCGGMFIITRWALATILTTVATLLMCAQEIIERAQAKKACSCGGS